MSDSNATEDDRGFEEDTLSEAAGRAEIDELRDQLRRLKQERDEWRDLALIDQLTGLPNRRAFDMQLARRIQYVIEHKKALAVLVVDLRNLKAINHEFGMPFADQVLRYVARRMLCVTRPDDQVFLSRLGGDENALIITLETPDVDALHAVALRVYESIGMLYKCREQDVAIRVEICIGGHVMGYETVNAEELYDHAAANLEEAKEIAYDPKSVALPIVLTN